MDRDSGSECATRQIRCWQTIDRSGPWGLMIGVGLLEGRRGMHLLTSEVTLPTLVQTRALPTETKVESVMCPRKSGTVVNLRK